MVVAVAITVRPFPHTVRGNIINGQTACEDTGVSIIMLKSHL